MWSTCGRRRSRSAMSARLSSQRRRIAQTRLPARRGPRPRPRRRGRDTRLRRRLAERRDDVPLRSQRGREPRQQSPAERSRFRCAAYSGDAFTKAWIFQISSGVMRSPNAGIFVPFRPFTTTVKNASSLSSLSCRLGPRPPALPWQQDGLLVAVASPAAPGPAAVGAVAMATRQSPRSPATKPARAPNRAERRAAAP